MENYIFRAVNCARFFLILVDEVESHHVEQLPLCITFVDDDNNIREKFLEFGQCEQIDGNPLLRKSYIF